MTHGTATLEETAYFLHLTVKSSRPVVVTGAMRPPSSLGTDADVNLLDAIRVASSSDARHMGVLTVLNNEIQSAREVTKAKTFRLETFRPNELGFLGYADSDGTVVFYRTPTRKHTTATPFDMRSSKPCPGWTSYTPTPEQTGCSWTPCGKTAPTAWSWWDSAAALFPRRYLTRVLGQLLMALPWF